jgi:hypothetical protein
VQFIHESARDFLIKDKGLQQMWPELGLNPEGPSHEMLKQCCNIYTKHVTLPILNELKGELKTRDDFYEFWRPFPFLEYACQHIFYHADTAAGSVPQDKFLSTFQISDWIYLHNCLEKFGSHYYRTSDGSAAWLNYILADQGRPNLIRTSLQHDPAIHQLCPTARYKYPIFAALAAGNKETVAALLNTPSYIYDGEDIMTGLKYRKDFKGYEHLTPLTWAAKEGRTSIVQLLLLQGEDPCEKDRKSRCPLFRALDHGHEAAAKLLINSGGHMNFL